MQTFISIEYVTEMDRLVQSQMILCMHCYQVGQVLDRYSFYCVIQCWIDIGLGCSSELRQVLGPQLCALVQVSFPTPNSKNETRFLVS